MLVSYVRDAYNRPFACVVATDAGRVGFSICHPRDTFNKKRAVSIATGRANKVPVQVDGVSVTYDLRLKKGGMVDTVPTNRSVFADGEFVTVKEQLTHAIFDMYERSIKYFKGH